MLKCMCKWLRERERERKKEREREVFVYPLSCLMGVGFLLGCRQKLCPYRSSDEGKCRLGDK